MWKQLSCTNYIFVLAHVSANWMFKYKHITSTKENKCYQTENYVIDVCSLHESSCTNHMKAAQMY